MWVILAIGNIENIENMREIILQKNILCNWTLAKYYMYTNAEGIYLYKIVCVLAHELVFLLVLGREKDFFIWFADGDESIEN